MNKKILTSLYALCFLLGFTACKDVLEYVPAEIPTNAQVYFSSTAPTTVLLSQDMNVTSFNVALYRIDKANALTVNLKVENENPGIFTVPTAASFAAGAEVAQITITYDPEELGFDVYKSISLAITDESVTTPYGSTSYAFTAGIPGPWKSLGTALLSETYVHVGSPWKVELQQNELFPNRYRLVAPFADADYRYTNIVPNDNLPAFLEFQILPAGSTYTTFDRDEGTFTFTTTVNGLVVYEPTPLGLTYNPDAENAEVYIWFPSARPLSGADTHAESFWLKNTVTRWSSAGEPEVVQIAPWYVMPAMGGGGWNYTQSDGMITIIFPGVELIDYDYSIKLDYLGHYIDLDDVDNAIVQFTIGDDVANYKYAIIEDVLNASAAVAAANEIIAGTRASYEDTESGYKIFPLDGGKYTVVAVSFDENGEEQDFDYAAFEFIPAGTDNPWISLGFCKYTDDLLVPLYVDDPSYIVTYDVEIFEHKDTPGLFRLKNAYGADYPYNDPGDYEERDVYIEINATDPDGVFIDLQSMGVDWGYGTNYIYSLASYYMDNGYSFEDVKADGLCGSFKNNIITFPENGLIIVDDDDMYDANTNGMFKVDMTNLRSSASKSAPLRSGITRSRIQEKALLSMKNNHSVRVKGKNVPASAIRGKITANSFMINY